MPLLELRTRSKALQRPKRPPLLVLPTFSLTQDAVEFLNQFGAKEGLGPIDSINRVMATAEKLQRTSRAALIKRIAIAYAVSLRYEGEPDFGDLISSLARRNGIRLRSNTDPIAVIAKSMISYGETKSPEAQKRSSRDVAAIHYLKSLEIPPGDVAKLAKKRGEGVDAWSRKRAAESLPGKKDKPVQRRKLGGALAPGGALVDPAVCGYQTLVVLRRLDPENNRSEARVVGYLDMPADLEREQLHELVIPFLDESCKMRRAVSAFTGAPKCSSHSPT